MSSEALPREQGATARAGRNVIVPANDNTRSPGAARPITGPLPTPANDNMLSFLETADDIQRARRVASAAIDIASFGVKVSPYGRILNAMDFILFLEDVTRDLRKRGDAAPADPNPDYSKLSGLGWIVNPNWPPPIDPAYNLIYEYRRNPTTLISNHPDNNVAGGDVLPSMDWISVAEGDVVYAVVQGTRTDLSSFPAGVAYRTQGSAYREVGALDPFAGSNAVTWYLPTTWQMGNPNIERNLKTEPVQYEKQVEEVTERVWDSEKVQTRVSARRPPETGETERKFLSRSARFMIAMFKGLDAVSELSEIVDVFYDAIPQKLRDEYEKELGFRWMHLRSGKWVKVKPPSLKRGLLDKAGQYGIDGADWKANAVRKHFMQIDVEKAFKGLINNATQDFVHGQLHKNLPRNTGKALDDGIKQVENFLQEFVYQ